MIACFPNSPFNFSAGGGPVSTSYSNTGGSGDRTGLITITQSNASPVYPFVNPGILIDGSTTGTGSYLRLFCADGEWITFDFGSAKVVDEARFYQTAARTQGTWKFQGSNDGSSYTDIGSSFTLGDNLTTQTITAISGNTTSYRYLRLIKVSGSTDDTTWTPEIEFKISA